MICEACKNDILTGQSAEKPPFIGCSSCNAKYHIGCLNLSRDAIRAARTGANNYRCPACKSKDKVRVTDSTPVRSGKRIEAAVSTDGTLAGSNKISCTSEVAPASAPADLQSFTESMRQLQCAFNRMKAEMVEFTSSLNITTEDMQHFRKEIIEMKKELKELDRFKTEVIELRAEVLDLRQQLDSREQRLFHKDIELSGITEHSGENLSQIISNVTVKLGVDLDPRDIDDIKRVGVRGQGGGNKAERPRPVILTLTRRAPRDQLLRAARVRRGLTTDMIQVPGAPRRVYLNEHLTKSNRVLYSKARAAGAQLKFKFVWTSNGKIFMRRTETSSVLSVSSEAVIDKLLKQNHPLAENQSRLQANDGIQLL